ncbi:MAG: hypothetical protein Q7Q71_03435 [Verrucomicrobiota bacterium JB023]|nr:hypothetical protein [Verrucomicrobiota bacterium JB023]
MRSLLLFSSILGLLAGTELSAQWRDETYQLRGGWNAIYLDGDASYQDLGSLLTGGDASSVLEVWRWNPNPTAVQFTEAPQIETPGTPEWSVWKRLDSSANTFSRLSGGFAYLVRCSGEASDSYSVSIRQSPLVPDVQWVREGANLLGFQTPVASAPTFASYFESFPAAITGSDVYQYAGGELGPSNPVKVFSTAIETVDRNQAYWFETDVVSDFQSEVKVECSLSDGLVFGDEGTVVRVTLRNRGSSEAQVTFSHLSSEAAPPNTRDIVGMVPLVLREYDHNTLSWQSTPMTGSFTRHVTAGSSLDLYFAIDRTQLTVPSDSDPAVLIDAEQGDYFASLLKLEDAAGKMEVYLPVSAEKGSLAGLWLGDVSLDGVESLAPGQSGLAPTSREMRLRMLLHVDEEGTARLLSQAFTGIVEGLGVPGIVTDESLLDEDYLARASRYVAAHLPLDQIVAGAGSFGIGGSLTHEVTIPFTDPTNPFVHQYHPDHDNLDARFEPIALPQGVDAYNAKLSDGVEAPGIRRTCRFTFTPAQPSTGLQPLGWGSTVVGGLYQETLAGVHKQPLTVSGSFELRRISDIGTLTTP